MNQTTANTPSYFLTPSTSTQNLSSSSFNLLTRHDANSVSRLKRKPKSADGRLIASPLQMMVARSLVNHQPRATCCSISSLVLPMNPTSGHPYSRSSDAIFVIDTVEPRRKQRSIRRHRGKSSSPLPSKTDGQGTTAKDSLQVPFAAGTSALRKSLSCFGSLLLLLR